MMQVVPKWKVVVTFPSREVVFWVSDVFLSNVLRQVAVLQFSDSGVEQPIGLTVSAASITNQTSATTTTGCYVTTDLS